jgi:RNA polymerase-binding transcription factor DksA
MEVNAGKTKAMMVSGGKWLARQSTPAYKRRMTGEGLTYRAKKRRRVQCPLCAEAMTDSYLPDHLRYIHYLRRDDNNALNNDDDDAHNDGEEEKEAESAAEEEEEDDPEITYRMSMISRQDKGACPKCSIEITSRRGMRRHFMHRHLNDKIIIDEEGELPRCPRCGLFGNHGRTHHLSAGCIDGKIRKDRRDMKRVQRQAQKVRFTIGDEEIETVHHFKYLGRITSDDDDDLPAVRDNLKKARMRWARVSKILKREGATAKSMGKFYLAVVQSVLLYGSETWVLSKKMKGMLESFHHGCARQMTRRFIRPDPENDGEWIAPPTAITLAAAGLLPLMSYVEKRKAAILVFAETRAIYRRCRRSTPIPGNVNQLIWWQSPARLA